MNDFFRALELRRTQALVQRVIDVVQRLHAPGYQLVTPAGGVMDRSPPCASGFDDLG